MGGGLPGPQSRQEAGEVETPRRDHLLLAPAWQGVLAQAGGEGGGEMSSLSDLSLDDLFKLARKQHLATVKPAATAKKAAAAEKQSTLQLYANPENWIAARSVAIIHSDSNTLLGKFTEFRHRTEAGTTKLVADGQDLPLADTLYVAGSWWLAPAKRPEPPRLATERRTVIMHLHLDSLGVHAPAVELNVILYYGAIDRVELAVETLFSSESPDTLLTLPAGVNVRELLSLDQRIQLKGEAGV